MMAMPRVAVMGGSLGGLTAALWLRDAGCDVEVFERSGATLQARGAGIVALDSTLRYLRERRIADPDTICASTGWIRFLRPDGSAEAELAHRYRYSSWNTVYRTLLATFGGDRYRLGCGVESFAADGDDVHLRLGRGGEYTADLLVCADGVNSTARPVLAPDAVARYAGYVGWRGTVPEADLSAATRSALQDAITYQVLPDSHILVYPIPGPDGAVEAGRRLMNFVWYRNVAAGAAFDEVMTGTDGVTRQVSLPPGMARPGLVEELRATARARFAPVIAEAVTTVAQPFVQAIVDIEVPTMYRARACLIGDAAFAVRPHAAAGTAKAAEDGWMLAEHLRRTGGDVPAALHEWNISQLALGRDLIRRTREIGDWSQFSGEFRPGDPRLIFGLYGPGQ